MKNNRNSYKKGIEVAKKIKKIKNKGYQRRKNGQSNIK